MTFVEDSLHKSISEMSDKQLAQELTNFQRYRLSNDPAKRAAFQKNQARYQELMAANEKRSGFRLEVSIGVIANAAKNRRFVSYKDIADANNVDWNRAYRLIGGHLWDLVEWSHAQWGFMISAVIVNKEHMADGTMEPETLAGFVRAAEEIGFRVKDQAAFLAEQQARVFEHFRT